MLKILKSKYGARKPKPWNICDASDELSARFKRDTSAEKLYSAEEVYRKMQQLKLSGRVKQHNTTGEWYVAGDLDIDTDESEVERVERSKSKVRFWKKKSK